LYFQIIFNSKVLKLPIGVSLEPKFWDKNKSYPKGRNVLSKRLEKKEQELKDFIDECDLNGVTITKDLIKEFYNGKDQKDDFYYHFDKFTEKKFKKIKNGTKNHYKLLKKQLMEFKPKILIRDLDVKLMEAFFKHLKDKGIGNSGLAMRRKNLITLLEDFKRQNLIKDNYCKLVIGKFEENMREVFLNKAEVKKLKDANLEIGSLAYGLNLTRDMFLFSCYTGLRYSDVVTLDCEHISDGIIVKQSVKTENKVIIPLHKYAIEILKKYNYKKKLGRVFPGRCNVSVNRDLKMISKRAKIDKLITFHVGRHTFGSNLAHSNVQPFTIMDLMGHKDIRTTERYVNSDNEILSKAIRKLNIA
jgi:integrase